MPPYDDRPALSFRSADPGDVASVVALVESGYRGDASRAGWTTEADLLSGRRTDEAHVLEVVRSIEGRMLLAELDDELVGCCHLEARSDGSAYLGLFAVRPGLQGRGTGRALVCEAERVAGEEWSAGEMRLQVIRQREELVAWYERLGYRRTGELLPFAYDEPHVIATRADLEFAVMSKPLTAQR